MTAFSMPLFLEKVRDHLPLTEAEIRFFISHLAQIPDEQVSAFLAHAYHQPLSKENTVHLTLAMRDSGSKLNWQGLDRPIVDKHSTGGVGDKITICLAPLLSALGMAMPTIAGRGLGFTGGTTDKLEAIPGMSLNLTSQKIESLVREHGFAFGQQSSDIAPADKKLYALRDVTATIESVPLITASILSKKLSESLGYLVLDLKCGSGAFMATREKARILAKSLVETAVGAGTNTRALITNMDQPLGEVSGNWCETAEAVKILKNDSATLHAAHDVVELTKELATSLLLQTKLAASRDEAFQKIQCVLDSGKPYEIFCRLIQAQGADVKVFEKDFTTIPKTSERLEIKAKRSGYLAQIHAKSLGQALVLSKAGREKQSDEIDFSTSLHHPVKIGEAVKAGQTLFTLHTNHAQKSGEIQALLENSITIADAKPNQDPLVWEMISA